MAAADRSRLAAVSRLRVPTLMEVTLFCTGARARVSARLCSALLCSSLLTAASLNARCPTMHVQLTDVFDRCTVFYQKFFKFRALQVSPKHHSPRPRPCRQSLLLSAPRPSDKRHWHCRRDCLQHCTHHVAHDSRRPARLATCNAQRTTCNATRCNRRGETRWRRSSARRRSISSQSSSSSGLRLSRGHTQSR